MIASVGKAGAKKREARIAGLASAEIPTGTAADVALAVAFLDDPKASSSIKGDARKVLERLEGNGISESIHVQLREAKTAALKASLARVLAERQYSPALPDLIEALRSADSDEQRVQVLGSVRTLASPKDAAVLLGALRGEHSLAVRATLEETILGVLRKSGETGGVVDDLLAKIGTSGGGERQSLFRILGSIGGEKTRERLASIYGGSGDAAYRRDAIRAYLDWPDRSVLPDVEGLIGSTDDDVLRTAAEAAYIRLGTLPGPEPVAELVPVWRKAFGYAKKADDARRLFDAVLDYPQPESAALLKEWESHPNFGSQAKSFSNTLAQQSKGLPELKPGATLKGNEGRPRGKTGVAINSSLKSLTSWTTPDTWFTWRFKAAESGEFFVEIDQSDPHDDPSEFVVYLAGATLRGESKRTATPETFEAVRLSQPVVLEAGQVYTLVLAAGRKIQPRMMDIGGVRLVKVE